MRAIAILLALPALAALGQGSEFDQELEAGKRLFDAGKYAEAEPHFARARMAEPKRWQGHTWHAFALIQLAYAEPADSKRREDLLHEVRALTGPLVKQCGLDFSDPLRHYLLGLVEHGAGEVDASFKHFAKARASGGEALDRYREIRLDEQIARAYGRAAKVLGERLLQKGKFKQAHPILRDALAALEGVSATQADVAGLHRALALTSEKLGQSDQTLQHLEALLVIDGQDPMRRDYLLAAIATIHLRAGKLERGRDALGKIPDEVSLPRVIEARCLAKKVAALQAPGTDALRDALAAYDEALRSHPEQAQLQLAADYAELALAQAERGPVEKAVERLVLEVERHPAEPLSYLWLQRCHLRLGNEKEAARCAQLHEQKQRARSSAD